MSRRKSKKQVYFNDRWLNEKECDINMWIFEGNTSTSFRCNVCKGSKDKTLREASCDLIFLFRKSIPRFNPFMHNVVKWPNIF